MSKGPPRTVHKSFRIEKEASEILETEARRRDISPSALVNELVVAFAKYGRLTEQMGGLWVTRKTLAEILNATQDEALIEIARQAARSTVPAFLGTTHGHVSFPGIRELMEDQSKYAHPFQFNETQDSNGLRWTLLHELGLKWSLFLANFYAEAFRIAGVQVRHEISDRIVIFRLTQSD